MIELLQLVVIRDVTSEHQEPSASTEFSSSVATGTNRRDYTKTVFAQFHR